jgi:hypothetical protein
MATRSSAQRNDLITTILGEPAKGKRTALPVHYQDKLRAKIAVGRLIDRVQNHVFGEIEMSPSQVHGAFKLIDKCLPNAIPVEVKDNLQANTAQALQSIQHAQLMAMAQEMLQNQSLTIEHQPGTKPVSGQHGPVMLTNSGCATPDTLSDSGQPAPDILTNSGYSTPDMLTQPNQPWGGPREGVGVSSGISQSPDTHQESLLYPELPDHLG